MNGLARMRDVARLAGVATMTVSRVINGHEHVSEETRRRVFEAVEALNYRPNTIARSLREQRSRQIGVIVPNIHDPFFAVCAQQISMVAKEYEYSVNIAMSDEEPEAEYNEAVLMLQRNVEGLIVVPSSGAALRLGGSEFAQLPIVCLDRPLADTHFDSVVVKNAEGSDLATRHLLEHGHTRIAYIDLSLDLYTLRERRRGYKRAMQKARLKPEFHSSDFTPAEMISTLREIISGSKPATAIFCGNNLTSLRVLHGLAAIGAKVPQQVAVIGFDDFEAADLLDPAITVVAQPVVEMGRSGARLLFSRILHKSVTRRSEQVVLPVQLVVRGSCGSHAR